MQSGDVHLALLAQPLPGPPKGQTLVLGFDLTPSDAALAERNRRVLAVLIGLLTAFTLFTAIVLDRGIFRPLERMRAATNALRLGDLGTRLRWRRQDELGQLAHDFDEMASTLESSQTTARGAGADRPAHGSGQPPRVPGSPGARHRPGAGRRPVAGAGDGRRGPVQARERRPRPPRRGPRAARGRPAPVGGDGRPGCDRAAGRRRVRRAAARGRRRPGGGAGRGRASGHRGGLARRLDHHLLGRRRAVPRGRPQGRRT